MRFWVGPDNIDTAFMTKREDADFGGFELTPEEALRLPIMMSLDTFHIFETTATFH